MILPRSIAGRVAIGCWLLVSGLGCSGSAVRIGEVTGATDDPVAERSFRAARDEFDAGRRAEAGRVFAAFARQFPRDPLRPTAELYLARILLAGGDAAGARGRLAALLESEDAAIRERARFFDGLARGALSDHAGAIEALAPFAGRLIDRIEAAELYRTLARSAAALGEHARSLRYHDALARTTSDAAERARAIATCRTLVAERLDDRSAVEAYEALPHDGPAWPMLTVRIARDALRRGDFDRAEEVLDAIQRENIRAGDEVDSLVRAVRDRRTVDAAAIGCVLPLSGRAREVGDRALRGLLLAAQVFGGASATGQGGRFRLAVRDDGGEPARAARAVEELVLQEHVIAIVGSLEGATSEAAGRRAEEYGVPILALSPRTGLTAIGPNVFRYFVTNEAEVAALVDVARMAGARRFAVLYPDVAYGQTMRELFAREVQVRGGQIVAQERYAEEATSFGEPVGRLRGTAFDALLVPDAWRRVGLIAPALAAAGLTSVTLGEASAGPGQPVQLLVPSVGFDAELIRAAGRYLRGAIFSVPFFVDPARPAVGEFVERYRAQFNEDPTYPSAFAYDAFNVVRRAVETGSRTRAALRAALLAVRDGPAVAAIHGFRPSREPDRSVTLVRMDADGPRALP